MRKRKYSPIWTFLALLILALFLIFVVYPLGMVLYKSVVNPSDNSITMENFTRFFTRKYYTNTLKNSFSVTIVSTLISATLGLVTPSIIVILLVAAALHAFRQNRYVDAAFYTLRPASTGLIAAAGWSVLVLVLLNVPAFRAGEGFLALFRWKNLRPLFHGASLVPRRRRFKVCRSTCPSVTWPYSALARDV